MFSLFQKWFWNPAFWLPPGVGWDDIKNTNITNGIVYPEFRELLYPIPIAFGLLLFRVLFDRIVIQPLGISLGIKVRNKRAQPKVIPILESAYKSKHKHRLNDSEIQVLASQSNLSVRNVERWLRKRTKFERATTQSKFSESSWRSLCYASSFLFGLYALWDKEWLWDTNYLYLDYPHHNLTGDIWCYYMLCSTLYWSLLFSQFSDIHRKDFWEMFVHHLATLCLLAYSFTCNYVRIGSLIILLHDSADVMLELTKVSKYAGFERTCEVLFVLLTLVWTITRLGIFPVYIITTTLWKVPMASASYYIFNSMLMVLLGLHIFWTYFLFKMIWITMSSGKLDKDTRSSSGETISDIDDSFSTGEGIDEASSRREFGATGHKKLE